MVFKGRRKAGFGWFLEKKNNKKIIKNLREC
jgi:hypothetical protein